MAEVGGTEGNEANEELPDELWALRDVSFEVKRGEVLGIIGRNGAGKSTLLKLLTRITEPTLGRAIMRGRVASLLEVGTGFHPELTGRENVYLNGAILGMRRAEITCKFDEIVDFSGVDKFIDTPVKRYSSGMYVRLAFAVAAHLDPEILLVDEVLAVGDIAFQRKCLGKMGEVARGGKTVLFVSHNMNAVQRLCSHGLLLGRGQVETVGDTSHCVDVYTSKNRALAQHGLGLRRDRVGTGEMRIESITIRDSNTGKSGFVESGNAAQFEFSIRVVESLELNEDLIVRFTILDSLSNGIAHCSNILTGYTFNNCKNALLATCRIEKLALNRGIYLLSAYVGTVNEAFDYITDAAHFEVVPGSFFPTGKLPEAAHLHTLLKQTWCQE